MRLPHGVLDHNTTSLEKTTMGIKVLGFEATTTGSPSEGYRAVLKSGATRYLSDGNCITEREAYDEAQQTLTLIAGLVAQGLKLAWFREER